MREYTLCISGPIDPPNYSPTMRARYWTNLETVAASRGGKPTAIMTGCAYGIDTDVLRAALELWRGVKVIFAVPDAPHNVAMVNMIQANYMAQMTEHFIKCADPSVGKRYMARNDWMAEHATCLASFPHTSKEQIRSGTWSTIRRFRKRDKEVYIFPLNT
jgi:predicted Rossmann fold nucleotide-binding protein DprA/Smf involved in DNA uptake